MAFVPPPISSTLPPQPNPVTPSGDRPLESPSPTAQEIQALFNRIAPVYDRLNQQLSWGLHGIWKHMAIKWVNPQPGDTCLDVCCGSGDLALLLGEAVGAAGQVHGVDFAAEQLAIAAQRAQAHHPPLAITWHLGDALHLPFEDDRFDGATLAYGLRNVVDIPRCLGELRRVLRPGAKVAILDLHRPGNSLLRQFQSWYLAQQVVPIAQDLGLREEYAYLAPSLDRFPTGREQVALAQAAGLRSAKHYPIAGGMMGVLVAQK